MAGCHENGTNIIVTGGNFAVGLNEEGELLPVIVDGEAIFSYDTALRVPHVFAEEGLDGVEMKEQQTSNLLPCAFFAIKKELAPGESMTVNEVYGQVEKRELLLDFLQKELDNKFFDAKHARARALTSELTASIETHTGNQVFDAYCKYTFMDNVLRGGQPLRLNGDKIFYVYSRKHGDLERDYNYFRIPPEFYSQGSGNYRDVNQNRRNDTFFYPFVARQNLLTFLNLIQLDGYNPLNVEQTTYVIDAEAASRLTAHLAEGVQEQLMFVLASEFTPGKLYAALSASISVEEADRLSEEILSAAAAQQHASFGEGYWSDHWTYNLDLLEEYLTVFPEKERELLYAQDYRWFLTKARVNPRARRYVETQQGLRQYRALEEAGSMNPTEAWVRDTNGGMAHSCLIEKLCLLCAIKFATLDPYGMGIEMEGGKPGWYDALNGLPGILGSSMAETCELARLMAYTISVLERNPGQVPMLTEIAELMEDVRHANQMHSGELESAGEQVGFWNAINDAKETYRSRIYAGISGQHTLRASAELASLLSELLHTVRCGMDKAGHYGAAGSTVYPTYFSYEATAYRVDADGIHPTSFALHGLPAFLEGPVHLLKLNVPAEQKKALYEAVRKSELYDSKLSMYRVNASLQDASYELGRARAFTPGWLENASIWLHMEYKYLLELLRSGMYEEFFQDFRAAAVPFLDPERYGRSTLENSSFIASSANPNERIHGRGFVARLSGSTAEFLSIWRRMMFGEHPFALEQGKLTCSFAPAIPSYLIGDDLRISATFLGNVRVTYRLPDRMDYIPGHYQMESVCVHLRDSTAVTVQHGVLREGLANALRDGMVDDIEVTLSRNGVPGQ